MSRKVTRVPAAGGFSRPGAAAVLSAEKVGAGRLVRQSRRDGQQRAKKPAAASPQALLEGLDIPEGELSLEQVQEMRAKMDAMSAMVQRQANMEQQLQNVESENLANTQAALQQLQQQAAAPSPRGGGSPGGVAFGSRSPAKPKTPKTPKTPKSRSPAGSKAKPAKRTPSEVAHVQRAPRQFRNAREMEEDLLNTQAALQATQAELAVAQGQLSKVEGQLAHKSEQLTATTAKVNTLLQMVRKLLADQTAEEAAAAGGGAASAVRALLPTDKQELAALVAQPLDEYFKRNTDLQQIINAKLANVTAILPMAEWDEDLDDVDGLFPSRGADGGAELGALADDSVASEASTAAL